LLLKRRKKESCKIITCPATAKPSERRDDVNQTCKQVWKAAIGVAPSRAANEAAKVTQNVTATTLANRRPPGVHAYNINKGKQ
jgi:hypothetical protein